VGLSHTVVLRGTQVTVEAFLHFTTLTFYFLALQTIQGYHVLVHGNCSVLENHHFKG